MEYVLFSCGDIGESLKEKELKVKLIISFDANELDNKNIISAYKFKKIHNGEKILIPSFISDDANTDEIYYQLINVGFIKEDIYFIPIEQILKLKKIDCSKFYHFGEIVYLDYLEINIIDCCNMNCKGCSHFANIASKEEKNFDNYFKDFLRLHELIPHIFKIRIMGGEPLLNSNLKKYIEMVRKIYPYTDLRVVTNGLLISSLSEDIIECFKENDVMVDISVYPPLRDKIDDIIQYLKTKGIRVFLENISSFKPVLLDKKQKYPYQKLINCSCINLQNGYLSACPLAFTIKYLNEKYNNKYDKKIKLINIYDNITGYKIKEQLKQPFELCDYCAHYRDDLPFFKWEQRINNCELSDWIYEEGK